MSESIRFPYEESSVYCSHDPLSQDMLPDVDVCLHPGDILFVPKGWWHFVVTESPLALSVNAWIDDDTDGVNRVEEALTRFCLGSICGAISHAEEFDDVDLLSLGWVNLSEMRNGSERDFFDHRSNVALLIQSLEDSDLLEDIGDKSEIYSKLKLLINDLVSPEAIRRSVNKLKAKGQCTSP